jgi:hypothetical protein
LAQREQKHLDRSLALALLSKELQRLFIWLSFAPTIDRAPNYMVRPKAAIACSLW